jgi:hypothetical protein
MGVGGGWGGGVYHLRRPEKRGVMVLVGIDACPYKPMGIRLWALAIVTFVTRDFVPLPIC